MSDSSPRLTEFFSFVNERHRIYLRKAAGEPKPWTDDEILQNYKFTNVFRELDTVTIWIRKNWREPFADHPNLWLAMCIARLVNWPDSLAEIGFPETWGPRETRRAVELLERRTRNGAKAFTSAYLLQRVRGWETLSQQLFYEVLRGVWQDRSEVSSFLLSCNSLEKAVGKLSSYYGWGGFLSYEVVCDLYHTRYLCNASDIFTWGNVGPGARRGLNRIYGRPFNKYLSKLKLLEEMRGVLRLSKTNLAEHVPPMDMRDIEQSLCEFDKYERARLNQGRPRSSYNGRG